MTADEVAALKVGDRIRAAFKCDGTIDEATEHYFRLQWDRVKLVDVLSKVSPLWALLSKQETLP